jgi:hypothetical protein
MASPAPIPLVPEAKLGARDCRLTKFDLDLIDNAPYNNTPPNNNTGALTTQAGVAAHP